MHYRVAGIAAWRISSDMRSRLTPFREQPAVDVDPDDPAKGSQSSTRSSTGSEPAPFGSRLRAWTTRSAVGGTDRKVVRRKVRPTTAAEPSQAGDTSPQAGPSPGEAPSRRADTIRELGSRCSSRHPTRGDPSRGDAAAQSGHRVPSRPHNHPVARRVRSPMRQRVRQVQQREKLRPPPPRVCVAMIFATSVCSLHD